MTSEENRTLAGVAMESDGVAAVSPETSHELQGGSGAAAAQLSLSPKQPATGDRRLLEEGEPPSQDGGTRPAVALGCWMMVFEALGVVGEAKTMPADHFLHSARVSSSLEGWSEMVAQVRDALARSNVDRQTLLHAQYDTREGRRHLLQQAVLRTAKHANLNPGDWEPFSKALQDWLGPTRDTLEEKLLPLTDILLPKVPSATTFTPRVAYTPSARSPVSQHPALTPRNLTAEETLRMETSSLQAEVLSLREYKLKREAADKAEDSAIILFSLRKKLDLLREEQTVVPAQRRQQLAKDEDTWRHMLSSTSAADRQALLASHEEGHNRQIAEQAELLQHMNAYVDKIVADVPDGKLQVEVEQHEALVAQLYKRREDMKAEHAAARETLANDQSEEVAQMQRDNEAVRPSNERVAISCSTTNQPSISSRTKALLTSGAHPHL